jgi:hypothetical protein
LVGVVLVFVILAFIYSLVFPLGEINDEIPHFALISFIAEQHRPPLTLEERDAVGTKGDASPFYHTLVALLTQHVDLSDSPQLPVVDLKLERLIPEDGHVRHNIFHTGDDAFPFHGIALAWHLARLASIPLGAATIVAVYLAILAIYPERRYLALAAAASVAFIPRFVISSAVLNDDNLVFPLIAFSVVYLIWIAQGDVRSRTLIILGVLIGLATFAKYHGIVLVPIMTLLLLQLAWQKRWKWQTLLRRWGLVVLAFAITVGWWFVVLVIRFNQVRELGLVSGLLAVLGDPVITFGVDDLVGANGSSPSLSDWLNWADLTFRTFWFHSSSTLSGLTARGNLGVYWGVYVLIGLFTVIALWGLLRRLWRYGQSTRSGGSSILTWRPDVTVLVLVFLVYLGLVAARHFMQPSFVTAQGRHLFPALVPIAFLLVSGWEEVLGSWPQTEGGSSAKLRSSRDRVLAVGIGVGLLAFSLFALLAFIVPVFYPFLPLKSTDPDDLPIAHRVEVSFADGLDLVGYDLNTSETQGGGALPITLYWRVGKEQVQDYLVTLCLHEKGGQVATCHRGHPVDGRYPTRAWEEKYVIRDAVYLPTPACMPTGSYEVRLSVTPLRLDTPVATIDTAVPGVEPLPLGQVLVTAGGPAEVNDVDLWVEGKRHSHGSIRLTQLRQALTAITYQPTSNLSDAEQDVVRLLSDTTPSAPGGSWSELSPPITYDCPGGLTAATYSFLIDPALPPGTYQLATGEGSEAGLRVNVLTRARKFAPPDDLPVARNAVFAEDVELLGYEVDLSPRLPGEVINITAYWRTHRTMSHPYITSVHLLDNAVTMWGQFDNPLGGAYPHLLWAPGEYVKEEYSLIVAPNAPPGTHNIEFGVYRLVKGEYYFLPVTTFGTSEPAKHIDLGQVRVLDPGRTKPPDYPLTVELGGQIHLPGFDLSKQELSQDESLDLTLYWQAVDHPTIDYTVFTQLVGPDGQVWAQQDNQPQAGRYPTTSWEIRDTVVDRYSLPLRGGAPTGQYQLLVGMYDLQTGQRLQAIDAEGNRLPDDAIPLATLVFEEDH